MDEFATLALRAVTDLGVRGDFTAMLVLCDYLQERGDPRGERIRWCCTNAQACLDGISERRKRAYDNPSNFNATLLRCETDRFDTIQATDRYCRQLLCTDPRRVPEDLIPPTSL